MLSLAEMVGRLLEAIVLGGLVGLEREQRDRPAGLRTHLLVSLASATFMIISVDFASYQPAVGEGSIASRTDPARIASYVVAGMGFLGAGTIIRGRRNVKGITTAASLWLVTALGLAAGAGMIRLAWASTLAGLAVLMGLRIVERRMNVHREHPNRRRLRIDLTDGATAGEVRAWLEELGMQVTHEEFSIDRPSGRTRLVYDVRVREGMTVEAIQEGLQGRPGVERIMLVRRRV